MQSYIRCTAEHVPFYHNLRNWWRGHTQAQLERQWVAQGYSVPPPHIVKQKTLRAYAQRFKLRVLVETGTFLGDMVEALRRDFTRIYSIELDPRLCARARKRFAAYPQITIIEGDSGVELAHIVDELSEPALFWLDGHYSAGNTARGSTESPIWDELQHILGSQIQGHVILIDDARCFGRDPGYPTFDEIQRYVASGWPLARLIVIDDIIRIVPEGELG